MDSSTKQATDPGPPDGPALTDASCTCSYCGLDNPAASVQCKTCERWFCNGKGQLAGSHIVTHMVRLKHTLVALHEASPLGAETLECYNCGNRNVFVLGFVAAKQDSVVVILCRMPCAAQRDINWDTNEWQPLIELRALLSWVAPVPTGPEMAGAAQVSEDKVRRLEAQWRINKAASIGDIDHLENEPDELLPVLLRFNDVATYHNAWVPLIDAEAECDKSAKELQALEHVSLQWSMLESGLHVADFTLSTFENSSLVVGVGDEVKLHFRDSDDPDHWIGLGRLVPSPRKGGFSVELYKLPQSPPVSAVSGFTVEFMWAGIPYSRMLRALEVFATNNRSVSAHLYHALLGHSVVDVEFPIMSIKKMAAILGKLNPSQLDAFLMAVSRPLLLIQGPPGTGKTVTSSAIVYYLSRVLKSRVLVCAPLNVAVDHLTQKLVDLGVKAVRIYARSKESVDVTDLSCSLLALAEKALPAYLRPLLEKQKQGVDLKPRDVEKLSKALGRLQKDILKKAEVVCCTCVGALDRRLVGRFASVLIDESTQAREPEALIPIVRGAKQVILVGDHQQMGPVVIDKRANKAGLSQSLFERLIALGHIPHRLEVQYRMNPALLEFSSNMFYEGSLQNGVTLAERTWPGLKFPWPVPNSPMMFWANYSKEELSANGSSYLNRVEAMNVERIISRLFEGGVKPQSIGVITPYEGQRAYIANHLLLFLHGAKAEFEEVEISSVDAFQGREKDFIILSCVRANDDRVIGFLRDPRRLNVALTRAKYGMVVLGNPRSLSRNKLWNRLLVHYREKGCLVEGPLDSLQLSLVPLTEFRNQDLDISPSKHFAEDTQSMLSYVPDEEPEISAPQISSGMDETKWPSLTANEASKLLGKSANGQKPTMPQDVKNLMEYLAATHPDEQLLDIYKLLSLVDATKDSKSARRSRE